MVYIYYIKHSKVYYNSTKCIHFILEDIWFWEYDYFGLGGSAGWWMLMLVEPGV